MEESRKNMRAFCFCTTLIFSLTVIIAGALTVRERTRKMIYGTDYAVLAFRTGAQSIYEETRQNELVVVLSFLNGIIELL